MLLGGKHRAHSPMLLANSHQHELLTTNAGFGLVKIGPHSTRYLIVRPARLERATFCFVGKRSIQLSYGRIRERLIRDPVAQRLLQASQRVSTKRDSQSDV